MPSVLKTVRNTASGLTRQGALYAGNAFDRVFRAASLVQAGQTPFETLHSDGLVSLRYYPPLQEDFIELDGMVIPVERKTHRTPIVIIPPLAVNMLIYDLFPQRSLVRFLRAKGFEVYLIDWGTPKREHTHYNMHTYVAELLPAYLNRVREHSGEQELSLHGWSMGGMFTLFYSALSKDQHIRNAIVLGLPIDSHASGAIGWMYQRIADVAGVVRKRTGFKLHDLKPHWFYTPGWANTIGFKLTNPVGSVMGYWELLVRLGDREFVTNHATTSAFLDRMVAYPGGVIQDTVVRVWIDNQLAKGRIQIGEDFARLENVNANLLAIAGQEDTLATPGAAKRVMDHVSSADKTFRVAPGGHMGILAGSKAPRASWLELAEWLAVRSD
ncbi:MULTISPECIES: alpha/beta fold hydrolase [unclassified Marinobacter]|jgi:polyhydroxyalkanoate synthase|uniref:alpha/beta fold hydrolase n=1 Tax=unclassified Marinobacter TaxID=83889 RepID=UPI000E9D0BDF|nr:MULTISPECIES: alpha/beta fold hydrolase [unclassified Marinobacter]HBM49073.1 alpha/beta hydrolase [Marinobacter sp.]|tara:strand:+ start:4891 stop:6042 length:1152 start_codon:yes stop_codon:yes gene_type:complete